MGVSSDRQNSSEYKSKGNSLESFIRQSFLEFLSENAVQVREGMDSGDFQESREVPFYEEFMTLLRNDAYVLADECGYLLEKVDHLMIQYDNLVREECLSFCYTGEYTDPAVYISDIFIKLILTNMDYFRNVDTIEFIEEHGHYKVPKLDQFVEGLKNQTSELADKFKTTPENMMKLIETNHNAYYRGCFSEFY